MLIIKLRNKLDSKAKQYFQNYNFKPENWDVFILEFEEAQKIINGLKKSMDK